MFLYHCIRQNISTAELGSYTTYSISAFFLDAGRCRRVRFVPDVSTDGTLVRSLAARCTAGQLDPCHLDDVIDDTLAF